ncbi:MAG TPA: hypothetical protein VGE29_10215 [Prosthecobacter sp.]
MTVADNLRARFSELWKQSLVVILFLIGCQTLVSHFNSWDFLLPFHKRDIVSLLGVPFVALVASVLGFLFGQKIWDDLSVPLKHWTSRRWWTAGACALLFNCVGPFLDVVHTPPKWTEFTSALCRGDATSHVPARKLVEELRLIEPGAASMLEMAVDVYEIRAQKSHALKPVPSVQLGLLVRQLRTIDSGASQYLEVLRQFALAEACHLALEGIPNPSLIQQLATEARSCFQKVVLAGLPAAPAQLVQSALINRVNILLTIGNNVGALEELNALKGKITNAAIFSRRARAFYGIGDLDKALADCQQWIEILNTPSGPSDLSSQGTAGGNEMATALQYQACLLTSLDRSGEALQLLSDSKLLEPFLDPQLSVLRVVVDLIANRPPSEPAEKEEWLLSKHWEIMRSKSFEKKEKLFLTGLILLRAGKPDFDEAFMALAQEEMPLDLSSKEMGRKLAFGRLRGFSRKIEELVKRWLPEQKT